MTEDIDKSRVMSPFDKLRWPLVFAAARDGINIVIVFMSWRLMHEQSRKRKSLMS